MIVVIVRHFYSVLFYSAAAHSPRKLLSFRFNIDFNQILTKYEYLASLKVKKTFKLTCG